MKLLSKSPEETSGFGARLAGLLRKGDTVCLFGDLGAGKTTFVKGVAAGLGIPERDITSASFTIVAEHAGTLRGAPVMLYHVDLYRIANASELDSVGIDGYIGGNGISVVEWAERLGDTSDCLCVRFGISDGERELTIEGIDEEAWNNL
ncbi:MAG TPA: tRNA (adenosine(37)-N6)-threonylcarbamoyltransferase complex ATPase subunit type 1 TsaE [Dissulfurispiraceae bacterium]